MKEDKDLERLFQEKFKDFEVTPPDFIWNNVQEKLHDKKEKKRIIPFWFQWSPIAASLLLPLSLITVLYLVNKNSSLDENIFEDKINKVKLKESNLKKSDEYTYDSNSTDSNSLYKNNSNTDGEKIFTKSSDESISLENNSKNGTSSNLNSKIIDNISKKSSNYYTSKTDNLNPKIKNSTNRKLLLSKKNKSILSRNLVNDYNSLAETFNRKNSKNKGVNSKFLNTNSTNKTNSNSELEFNNSSKNSNFISNSFESYGESNSFVLENQENINLLSGLELKQIIVHQQICADSLALAQVSPEENPLEKLLREKENKIANEKEKTSKWAVNTFMAPVYFNSFTEGSPLSSEFESNNKSYSNSVSYGVGVAYTLAPKLSVRGGVNNLNLDFTTEDVIYYASIKDQENSKINIDRNQKSRNLAIETNKNYKNDFEENLLYSGKNSGSIKQSLQYIEVPLELNYALIDKKFNVSIRGGLSTLFLSQNRTTIVSENEVLEVGKASNLNDIHFSTNIGLGIGYAIFKNFQASFEPMFKYQLNTYSNNDGNFKPYMIGLNTGITYKF